MIRLIERWALLSLMMLNISGITSATATAEGLANNSVRSNVCLYSKVKDIGDASCFAVSDGEIINIDSEQLGKIKSFDADNLGYFTLYSDRDGKGYHCTTFDNQSKGKCDSYEWRQQLESLKFNFSKDPVFISSYLQLHRPPKYRKTGTGTDEVDGYSNEKFQIQSMLSRLSIVFKNDREAVLAWCWNTNNCDECNGCDEWALSKDNKVISKTTIDGEVVEHCLKASPDLSTLIVGDCKSSLSDDSYLFYYDGMYFRNYNDRDLVLTVRKFGNNEGQHLGFARFNGSQDQQWFWGKQQPWETKYIWDRTIPVRVCFYQQTDFNGEGVCRDIKSGHVIDLPPMTNIQSVIASKPGRIVLSNGSQKSGNECELSSGIDRELSCNDDYDWSDNIRSVYFTAYY